MQSSKYKRKENTLHSYAHPKSLKLGMCRANIYELERGINVHPDDNHRKLRSMPPLWISRRFLGFQF